MMDNQGNIDVSPAVPVQGFADSVGAGDAFAAILILGLIKNWPFPECLNRANQFAARICGIQGAFPADRSFYDAFTKQWELK